MTRRIRTRVSDHAVVRYLERVGGFDIARLKLQIAERVDAAAIAGADAVTVEGVKFIIASDDHGPIVTTVVEIGVSDRMVVPHHRAKAGK